MKNKKEVIQPKSKNNPKTIVDKIVSFSFKFVLPVVIVSLVAAFSFKWHKSKDKGPDVDPNAIVGQLEGKTPREIQMELDRVVKETSMVISINTKVKMKDGNSLAPLKIENVPKNHYIMQVSIVLPKSEKEIYKSGLVYPNYHIEKVKFNTVLKKGTYEAVAVFSAYDLKSQKKVGEQRANITIEVEQ